MLRKSRPLHPVQRVLSLLVPIRVLRYTGGAKGIAALDREVRIIERLRQRGARVPHVIARADDWIALEDIGPTLEKELYRAPNRSDAFRLCFVASWGLLRLHRRQGWHGNPQARNITLDGERVGFIDFEEDVGARLGEKASQTRDWGLFLSSLNRTETRFPGLTASLVRSLASELPAHCRRFLFNFRLLCAPLAVLLLPFKRLLGRDVRQVLTLWEASGEIDPQVRRRFTRIIRIGAALAALLYIYVQQTD